MKVINDAISAEVLHISCNMCTPDLSDMYALVALGLWRQIPYIHVLYY